MNNCPITFADIQDKKLNQAILGITRAYPIQYIICWAVNKTCNEKLSCFTGPDRQYDKHFFLLAITTDNTRIEYELQDYVNQKYADDSFGITLISHGCKTVKEAIENGSRFFNTVCKNGVLLYSSDGFQMRFDYPELDMDKTLAKAERHFAYRYDMAEGFLLAAEHCLDSGHNNHVAFFLHQCIEQACIAMIRVFMAYRTKTHKLSRLLDFCCCFSMEPIVMFQSANNTNNRLFDLLQQSYSDARYLDDYKVTSEEAENLYQLAHGFLALTKRLCGVRLAVIESGIRK